MSLSTPKSVPGMSLTANPTQRDCQTPWRPRIAEKEEAYLREMWALTSKEAWERPSAAAASHCSEAARRCDHWLRKLRSAAGLHSLSDEGDGDGEAAGWWGGRVGVAAELSIASPAVRCGLAEKGFGVLRRFVPWPTWKR
jgi:hypothetical protein